MSPDDGDGGGDPAGPDPLAENELAKYIAKIREARDKSNKNALILNTGVRLGRFIGAGRLEEDRVVREIYDAVRSRGATRPNPSGRPLARSSGASTRGRRTRWKRPRADRGRRQLMITALPCTSPRSTRTRCVMSRNGEPG